MRRPREGAGTAMQGGVRYARATFWYWRRCPIFYYTTDTIATQDPAEVELLLEIQAGTLPWEKVHVVR